MTPTHILVPIELIEKKLAAFPPEDDIDERYYGEYALLKELDNLPKVDLSEEGIENEANKLEADGKHVMGSPIKDYKSFETGFLIGYTQCAKDLLNTK